MNRRGYLIRLGGDPEIAQAIAQGVDRATQASVRHSSSDAVRRVAMAQHTQDEWQAMIAQAQYDYGQDRPTPKLARALLIIWALICYGLHQAYLKQNDIIGG